MNLSILDSVTKNWAQIFYEVGLEYVRGDKVDSRLKQFVNFIQCISFIICWTIFVHTVSTWFILFVDTVCAGCLAE